MAQDTIQSSRLRLEPLSLSHLDDFYEIQSSPLGMQWSTKALHTSIEQSRQMIQENQPTTEEPWNRRWAIILKVVDAEGDGQEQARREKMIGIIGTPRKGEIGYKIHPGYWGKGYMSEALALFLDTWWGMEENRESERIEAAADPENVGSIKVLQKAGFQKGEFKKGFYSRSSDEEGVKRDLQFFYIDRPSEVNV